MLLLREKFVAFLLVLLFDDGLVVSRKYRLFVYDIQAGFYGQWLTCMDCGVGEG